MRYFVLYDDVGTAQRIAQTARANEAQQFLDAGFVEVDEATYNALADTTERAFIRDLALLAGAGELLRNLANAIRQPTPQAPQRNDAIVQRIEQRFASRAQTITQSYYDGEISLDAWYRQMARAINANITASRGVAVGGLDNLTAQDLQAIELQTDEELRYLNRFRRDIESGSVSQAQALARAQQYGGSGFITYERGLQDLIGLPLLPAQPKVRTECRRNCKCSWDIQQLEGNDNWDCYWRLSPAEHCDTCLTRARTFNPLRIRNGIIQPFNPRGIYA